ncbi:MAG TPA: hypothetical protein VLA72_03905 [Anaerolineales bacterium]|nr:hypothetical protein [Anaerolineales bacterium]
MANKGSKERADNVAEAQFGETLENAEEIVREIAANKKRKEYTWHVAVGIAVLLMAASGWSVLAFIPVMFVMVFVSFWAFDVK